MLDSNVGRVRDDARTDVEKVVEEVAAIPLPVPSRKVHYQTCVCRCRRRLADYMISFDPYLSDRLRRTLPASGSSACCWRNIGAVAGAGHCCLSVRRARRRPVPRAAGP